MQQQLEEPKHDPYQDPWTAFHNDREPENKKNSTNKDLGAVELEEELDVIRAARMA